MCEDQLLTKINAEEWHRLWETVAENVYDNAKEKGWWDKERNDGEILCLMHSELSEALEWLRDDNPQSEHIPAYTGVEEELADLIIRLMDYGIARGFDLPGAILAKMEYNRNRPRFHGHKKF